jgi:triosephosphate isomerase (TIM)
MAGRNSLIAGNWKMNGDRAAVGAFLSKLGSFGALRRAGRELLICPPATLIGPMAESLAEFGVAIGGQDCHSERHGAFTGDISAAMLADLGCSHVIVGHSERRGGHGETDLDVRGKATAAIQAGLTPIICVGEIWADRESGHAERVVKAQVVGSVPDGIAASSMVVAYEPVWAIGTGRTPTLDDIAAMHHLIHMVLAAKAGGGRVLYGGSVKPGNAAEILTLDGVDGALVGGASLNAADFMAIADAAVA